MRHYSIIRRVVLVVILVELAFAVASTSLVYFYERHIFFGALDISLRGHADSLMGTVVEASDDTDSVMMDAAGLTTPKEDLYEVWEKDTLLGQLGNLSGGDPALRRGGDGFFRLRVGGRRYRAVRVQGLRVIDPTTENVRHEVVVLYASPTAGVTRAVERAVRFFALANAAILLLTGWLVFVFVRRSVAPLNQLAGEASTIAVNRWQFQPSAASRSVEEMAPLVGALEGVVGRLERSFRQQRVFVSDAAHELKTAVAVVKSSIQLLSMKERTSAEYQAGLELCQSDCVRMEELVHRMLLLATVEEGDTTEPRHECVRVMDVVREVTEELQPVAQLHDVRLEAPVGAIGDGLVAAIPRERWKTVYTELLLNAIQHSPKHGVAGVEVAEDAGKIRVAVWNGGEGIPDSALPHLFDRFYRGDPSRARSTGGTGLGLAICKAIVEQAGGTIKAENGPCVCIVVELPMGR